MRNSEGPPGPEESEELPCGDRRNSPSTRVERPEDVARIFFHVSELPPHQREDELAAMGLEPHVHRAVSRMLAMYEREGESRRLAPDAQARES